MNYLNASEYEAHGLDPATADAWVASASALIDAYCRRSSLGVVLYRERRRLDGGRATVRLSYLPLAVVAPATTPFVEVIARYAPAGDGDLAADVAQAFALPGSWTTLDPARLEYRAETGEVTLAANPLGFGFNEVEISYTAGFAEPPPQVKFACAQLVRNAQATPALNVRAGAVDRMHMEYFSDSLLDATIRRLLAPHVAVTL